MCPSEKVTFIFHSFVLLYVSHAASQATYLIILSISAVIGSIVLLQCCIVLIARKKRKRSVNIQERGRTNAPVINIKMDMTMEKKHSGGRSDERESYDDEVKRDTLAEKYDSVVQANPYATNKLFG